MRSLATLTLIPMFLVTFLACDKISDGEKDERNIAFERVEGYYISNKFPITSPTIHFVITDQAQWDSVFIPKPPPYDQNEITPVDFSDHFAVVVIKHGNSYWVMEVTDVTMAENDLRVDYTADCVAETMTWTAAIPCTIMIEKTPYSGVAFFENSKLVAEK